MKKIIIMFMVLCISLSCVGCSSPTVEDVLIGEYDLINIYQFHADYPVQARGINYHFQYIDENGSLIEKSINTKSDFLTIVSGDVNKVSFSRKVYSNGVQGYVLTELTLTEETIKSFS